MTGPPKGANEARGLITDILTASIVSVSGTTPEENIGFDDYTIALNAIIGSALNVPFIDDKINKEIDTICTSDDMCNHLSDYHDEVKHHISQSLAFSGDDTNFGAIYDLICYINNFTGIDDYGIKHMLSLVKAESVDHLKWIIPLTDSHAVNIGIASVGVVLARKSLGK